MNKYWKNWISNINKIIELETKLDQLREDIEFCNKNKTEIKKIKSLLRKEKRKALLNRIHATKGL